MSAASKPDGLAALIRSYLDDDEISLTPEDPYAEVRRNTWSFGHAAGADDSVEVAAALQDTALAVRRKLGSSTVPDTFYAWYDAQSGHLKCSLTSQDKLPFEGVFIEVSSAAIITDQACRDLSPGFIPWSELSSTPPPAYTEDPAPFPVWVDRSG